MCFYILPTSCPRFPQCDHVTGPQVAWKQAWLAALAALPLPYLRGGLCSRSPPRSPPHSPPLTPHCRHQRRSPGRWIPSMFSSSLTDLRPVCLQRQAQARLRLKTPGLGGQTCFRSRWDGMRWRRAPGGTPSTARLRTSACVCHSENELLPGCRSAEGAARWSNYRIRHERFDCKSVFEGRIIQP